MPFASLNMVLLSKMSNSNRYCRAGQNPIYTVYMQYIFKENHQIYGHRQWIYTVLANPTNMYIRCIYGIFGRAIICPCTQSYVVLLINIRGAPNKRTWCT